MEEGFDPAYSRVSESIFSLGNESIGARGFFDEGGSVDSLRGCYTNGVYDIVHLGRSYRGIVDRTHFMIPSADWLLTSLVLDGETLDLGKVSFRDFRRVLDLKEGTLTRSFVWETATGKALKLTFLRFLDMVHRERAYQRLTLEPLNFSGQIEFSAGVSFAVTHEGHGTCFWGDTRKAADADRILLQSRTTESGQEVFAGAVLDLPIDGEIVTDDKAVRRKASLPLVCGRALRVDRRAVILFDGSEGETLWERGNKALAETAKVSLEEALQRQKAYWAAYWAVSDIEIEPASMDEKTAAAVAAEQQGVRFCSFQLAQTYNGGSMRHNIGAKGLTGEAYNGHAFWDTESCCLPFYLFTNPEAARDLLLFRYNTLPMARERAKMLDCQGACYPIATLNGDEACPLWQHASLQLQPSTAVAYGIWHYVHLTDDEEFLWTYGAEMLLEIARFLKSRAALGNRTGKYGFFGVMGPDEFHMMVNNNAYTNYMGMRTLRYAAEGLEQMAQERPADFDALRERTGLGTSEIDSWRQVAENMYLPQDGTGLIEQHDGFFDLPHTDVTAVPPSEFPLYEHWSYDRIYRTDMIKQPDVLMMLYLYNSSFSRSVKEVNYGYYQPKTIHESSLSPAIHSILAAELGRMEEAVDLFGFATRLDLDNYNCNTREGLHITSIAMAWANIVYGFAGLRSDGPVLRFAPHLPERWRKLRFSLTYKGRVLSVRMEQEGTTFRLKTGTPIALLVYDKPYALGEQALFVPAQ
jgi:maltose phosphorylase